MTREENTDDDTALNIEDIKKEELHYAPKSASGMRRQRRILALTATVATCVIAVLGASLTFRSPFATEEAVKKDESFAAQFIIKDAHAPLSYQDTINTQAQFAELQEKMRVAQNRINTLTEELHKRDFQIKQNEKEISQQEHIVTKAHSLTSADNPQNRRLQQLVDELKRVNRAQEREIVAYKDNVKEKQNALKELKIEVATKDSILLAKEALIATLGNAQGENAALTSKLSSLSEQLEATEDDQDSLSSKLAMVSTALVESNNELSFLQDERSSLANELEVALSLQDKLKSELNELSQFKENSSTELLALREERGSLSEQLEQALTTQENLKGELTHLANLKEGTTSELSDIREERLQLANKLEDITLKKTEVESELEILKETYDEDSTELLSLREEHKTLLEDLESLTQEMARISNDKDELEQIKADSFETIAVLTTELNNTQSLFSEAKEQLASLTQTTEEKLAVNKELNDQLENLESNLAIRSQEKSQLETELSKLVEQLSAERLSMAQLEEVHGTLSSQFEQLNTEKQLWTAEKEALGQKVATLTNIKEALEPRVTELTEQLMASNQSFGQEKELWEAEYKSLANHIETLEGENSLVTDSASNLRQDFESLAASLENARANEILQNNEKKDLLVKLDLLKKDTNASHAEKLALLESLTSLRNSFDAIKEEKGKLSQKLQELLTVSQHSHQNLTAANESNRVLSDKLRALEQAHLEVRSEKENLLAELSGLSRVKSELTSEKAQRINQEKRFEELAQTVSTQKEMLHAIEKSRALLAGELGTIRGEYQELLNEISSSPTRRIVKQTAKKLPSAAKEIASAGSFHVVESGETLSEISLRHYGTSRRWRDIFEANRDQLPNQNTLKTGITLVIP